MEEDVGRSIELGRVQLAQTGDGSKTLLLPDQEEHYHSIHGALAESMHVFIAAGLRSVKTAQVRLLEIGMGTGLNVMLTSNTLIGSAQQVEYTAIEPYPLGWETIRQLEYTELLKEEWVEKQLKSIHEAPFDQSVSIAHALTLLKLKHIEDYEGGANLVYYDAFAPRVQPELWTVQAFSMIWEKMAPGGILVTYCAKGQVRRNMQEAGFEVERLPGPPGKREMMRATKND